MTSKSSSPRQIRSGNPSPTPSPELLRLATEQSKPFFAALDAKKKREEDISLAQRRLQEAGFAPGATDGKLSRQTRVALRQYQLQHKLMLSGILDDATRKALGIP